MAFEDDEDEDYGGEEDDFQVAVMEAFPDQQWDGPRLAALKEAIRLCAKSDVATPEPGAKKPGKGSFALVFGGPPKE